jgi:hypothetical protein
MQKKQSEIITESADVSPMPKVVNNGVAMSKLRQFLAKGLPFPTP